MPERRGPHVYTIPTHHGFADALAAGLIRRYGGDPLALARGLVLVPTNRAKRTLTEAFVRASGQGLLLPRLVAIGDADLDEAIGAALDPADAADPVPPAIAPLERRLILARLVSEGRAAAGAPVDAAEALRLAGDLARTLDQLLVEEIAPERLATIDMSEALAAHWQRSLDELAVILKRWPAELAARGRVDLATRRGRLLDALGKRWRQAPPAGFVCAAGVTTAAPAVARLLRVIAGLPLGSVVLPGLATDMDEAEWQALGPHEPDPVTGRRRRSIETHPQFQLKLLLDRMGVNRAEVIDWRDRGGPEAPAARARAIDNAMAPAHFTAKWTSLPAAERRLTGVRAVELATPAEEAQAIALALREVLETPGRTAALVTPDRALARRVAAHCARWGIAIDDSAGHPLSLLPPGTLLIELAEAAAQRFAPVPLLALVKHPLVRLGEARLAWLEGARALDLALRGPRPAPGLEGIDQWLGSAPKFEGAAHWWPEARALIAPMAACIAKGAQPLADLLAALRETADALTNGAAWQGPAGRAAADLLTELEAHAAAGPASVDPLALPQALRELMRDIAVRPPQGGHPRLAIYGLIEARLQRADQMILGGLNEGSWPAAPAPDPWLAPRIRAELGLPGLDRRIGLAAHDFAAGLGAPEVLLTRARRDGSAPTIASRLWLRLEAMLDKGVPPAAELAQWARAIDDPGGYCPAKRPAPRPPAAIRPRAISVTEVDRLKSDPFAFYARRMLRLMPLDPVDADPGPAWRGTEVHRILETWVRDNSGVPGALMPRTLAMLAAQQVHPLLRALWQPRLIEAIDWIARQVAEDVAAGRAIIAAEGKGRLQLGEITLSGTFDRLDRLADGTLAIVDYKTGTPPSAAAVRDGYSLQLGLLGLMAERGAFAAAQGRVTGFEYWSLAKKNGAFGYRTSPVSADGSDGRVPVDDFVALAADQFTGAVATWLTGDEPFTAKLVPRYAPYADYDQLMRLDEWYGRGE
ncbi:double-strand break repair protein AddB [Sphingomonas sp. GlSt437]|uniref:double-strand break repair protein AddB n=2 Tax=Bacteria TaxID=2 RepID=UPI003A845667